MPLTIHFDEDVIEAYAMGRLDPESAAGFEEHLLICPVCQSRLECTDNFVRAFRTAVHTRAPRRESATQSGREASGGNWWHQLHPSTLAWAATAAALAVILFGATPLKTGPSTDAYASLAALRGSGSAVVAEVPVHRSLGLSLVTTALGAPAYRLEIADAAGSSIWNAPSLLAVRENRISATVTKSLSSGVYWVRLFDPASGQLVREFGLRVKS
ncbi:MAG: zf-HC2 domain-containing protein [Acidobacteria bacterium]|nr:zf-HC2 domain-containing protein [Acidobacteriota bacterium]